jgi:hypothetical protein
MRFPLSDDSDRVICPRDVRDTIGYLTASRFVAHVVRVTIEVVHGLAGMMSSLSIYIEYVATRALLA